MKETRMEKMENDNTGVMLMCCNMPAKLTRVTNKTLQLGM